MARPLLILFAKAPVAGRVKTRLSPPLTPEEAAGLHTALVKDMAAMLLELGMDFDCELATDRETDAWPNLAIKRSIQIEGDLGARMLHAAQQGLHAGHSAVMILGSDSPGLPSSHVRDLMALPGDIALGPTSDGGYYAIRFRKTDNGMFEGVRWSSGHTLGDTVAAVSRRGLGVSIGPSWFDVDTEEDLRAMMSMSDPPLHLREWITGSEL